MLYVGLRQFPFRDLLERATEFALEQLALDRLDVEVSARDVSRGLVALRVVIGPRAASKDHLAGESIEYPQFVKSLATSLGAKLEIRWEGQDAFMQIEIPLTRAGGAVQM